MPPRLVRFTTLKHKTMYTQELEADAHVMLVPVYWVSINWYMEVSRMRSNTSLTLYF